MVSTNMLSCHVYACVDQSIECTEAPASRGSDLGGQDRLARFTPHAHEDCSVMRVRLVTTTTTSCARARGGNANAYGNM